MAATVSSAPDRERRLLGIALRAASASAFGVMAAMLKLASGRGVAATEMLFYRSVFGLPVVIGWLLVGPGLGAVRTRRPLAHLGRCALGMASILCTFKALTLLPLADATTIGFTAPIFATILSAVILGEAVGRHRWAAVAVGFIGILVVMRPGGHGVAHAGLAIALLSALGTAGVTVAVRQLGGTEDPASIVFWFFVCSIVLGALLLLVVGRPHPPAVIAMLVAAGVAGGVAQLLMTASLYFAPVSVTAPFDYVQLPWATALGWLIWNVAPAATTLAGATLIVASGLYTVWRERRRRIAPSPMPAMIE